MPVVLVSDKERFTWEHKDTNTKLFYRRPSSAKQRELQAQNTDRGLVDREAYLEDLIEWCVLGWDVIDPEEGEGFVDHEGKPIEFFEGATRGLPETYKSSFILCLYLIDPIKSQLGN